MTEQLLLGRGVEGQVCPDRQAMLINVLSLKSLTSSVGANKMLLLFLQGDKGFIV